MPRGAPRIFRYHCPFCGKENTPKCQECGEVYKFDPVNAPSERRIQQRIGFPERMWLRIKERAYLTPGIGSASEFVRLACCEVLALPPLGRPFGPARRQVRSAMCPKCGEVYEFDPDPAPYEKSTSQRIWFPESMWARIVARAKVTPGVASAAELVRLACDEVLAIPPHHLLIASESAYTGDIGTIAIPRRQRRDRPGGLERF
jgi:hypothetical protein